MASSRSSSSAKKTAASAMKNSSEENESPTYHQLDLQKSWKQGFAAFLARQMDATWPLESEILSRYEKLHELDALEIVDVGCGCGIFVFRLADLFPNASIVGCDLDESSIEEANRLLQEHPDREALSKRVKFITADVYALESTFEPGSKHLVTCRSMLYTTQKPERAIQQLLGITNKRVGYLHFLEEDHGYTVSWPTQHPSGDSTAWLRESWVEACKRTGADAMMARTLYTRLHRALEQQGGQGHVERIPKRVGEILRNTSQGYDAVVREFPMSVNTANTPRKHLAAILEAWESYYSEYIAKHSDKTKEEVSEGFLDMARAARGDEAFYRDGYFAWTCYIYVVMFSGLSDP